MTANDRSIMNTYQRLPLTLTRGKGSYVWTDQEEKFLDYTSGIATLNLGHIPPEVHGKLTEQMDQLWHCSNLFDIPAQQALATKLTELSCFTQSFFCNSGAEANEAAIKLAKKYAKDQGNSERTEIVSFTESFHGRTGTTLAATAQEKIHQGFTPITPGFRYLPFNDIESIDEIHNGKTTAVILELVQGEGGVRPANKEWVQKIAKLCSQEDILLIVDEVQTGAGRTGALFAYEQFEIEPDVMTLAKGLGSGFPVGAMLAKEHVATSFQPGTHGSTFGGNPLAMTAALATIETISQPNILQNVQRQSEKIFSELASWDRKFSFIKDVRGKGLLIGIEMDGAVHDFLKTLRGYNILVLVAGPNVIRILPPLNTSDEEVNYFLTTLYEVFIAQEKEVSL